MLLLLATARVDMVRALWKPPEPAAITLADSITSLLAVRAWEDAGSPLPGVGTRARAATCDRLAAGRP